MRATGTSWIIRDNSVGADRLTVDTAGNLGLGLAPTDTLSYGRAFDIQGTNGSAAYFRSTTNPTTVYGLFSYDNTEVRTNIAAVGASNYLRFISGGSEKARITSAGEFIVSGTSAYAANSITMIDGFMFATKNAAPSAAFDRGNSSDGDAVHFRYNGNTVGSVSVTSTLTSYNVTSDYRLKTVIGVVTGHGERLDALEPIEYEWKSNGSRSRGFLAHKFQEVYAQSVNGTKDAVDADGNPVYQSMQASTSEVIADLVAEIQSLRQRLSAANL